MLQISKYVPWDAWRRFALSAPKPHKTPTPLPRLSPHLARDIGLSDGDQDRANIKWPSDGPDRPLI